MEKIKNKTFSDNSQVTGRNMPKTIRSNFVSTYKKYNKANHVLISLERTSKIKKTLCTVFMDLSKAFVAYLMTYLVKMKAYGFSKDCLTFLYSYLKCWKQSVNIRNVHNMFQVLFSCVTQESILRSLLFNIFIKDLFYFIKRRTAPKFC